MLLAGLTRVARAVPLEAGYRLADAGSAVHRCASRARRRAVEDNLRALGVANPAAGVPGVYRNFGRTVFEFLRGPYLPELDTRIEGWESLLAARARGRGVVVAAPHTGNWTHAATFVSRQGVPVAAVAGTQLSGRWTPELRERQAKDGLRILPPGVASWREIPRLLECNHVVALLVDGDVFRGGLRCPVGGRSVRFPTGPAKLALRTGAALLPGWVLRDPDGGIRVGFGAEIPVDAARPDAVDQLTREVLAAVLEKLRQHPDQWLLFRRFFEDASPEAPVAKPTATGVAAWEGTP